MSLPQDTQNFQQDLKCCITQTQGILENILLFDENINGQSQLNTTFGSLVTCLGEIAKKKHQASNFYIPLELIK